MKGKLIGFETIGDACDLTITVPLADADGMALGQEISFLEGLGTPDFWEAYNVVHPKCAHTLRICSPGWRETGAGVSVYACEGCMSIVVDQVTAEYDGCEVRKR